MIATVVGSLDVSDGNFVARSTSVTGTGALSPISGNLAVAGTQNLTNPTFTETLSGRFCVPIAHRRALAQATTAH